MQCNAVTRMSLTSCSASKEFETNTVCQLGYLCALGVYQSCQNHVAAASEGLLLCFQCLQNRGQFLGLDIANVQLTTVHVFTTDV
jgi:hypothetical protein